jgi:metal-sulfur cluster biosynthetic enzyme
MNTKEVTNEQVLAALREVIDPEMGIDLVSLGLLYDVQIVRGRVSVKMTLTMRGCPMHESITDAVRWILRKLEGVDEVAVELVWDPPWNPAMMASDAQQRLS